ncbi:glucosamine--fructose-6-phosphate aminotransferase (isomerizing) [Olsenella profusa DSM 13989]|uniref:Glutamine--fructose-6-phosphate aminotransferase [isomerizing] n=1 Tax=Olsenella profusa F0195 TaxID=1125712 RepID=U2SYS6_9ACTN|nr:glutamine--fructose-6-phosphate transaminase (isomerizing) [Olsenella profusa]ERL05974.1 glutamine-fructose-6-phosphate transaminase (isomerizing) [Olsenella profusa F0195]MDP9859063.1 glucosamine--fructose-6-phosphate aminotransferase (isomerizing) [Olsenella profusa DSM 13989]
MCGVVGYTGKNQAVTWLLDGLQTLEYRGYDSAGVAILSPAGNLHVVKCAGRVATLRDRCESANLVGTCGIGHTRWATHGAPSDRNAHPHTSCDGKIAVVHNGIIENFEELRAQLIAEGHEFKSDTDTEVVAHLFEDAWNGPAKGDMVLALRNTTARLEGAWALAVTCADMPGTIVVTRKGSPLVVATTDDGAYAASDVMPLASVTNEVIQLDDDDIALLSEDGTVQITNAQGEPVREVDTLGIDWDASAATLGGYSDFMEKEISEQPEAIARLLQGRLSEHGIEMDELAMGNREMSAIDRIYVIACGTSYNVGLIAKSMIEHWARVFVSVEYASEFNYSDVLITDHTLCLIITQSGETADTLAAARRLKAMGCRTFAVTNVLGSSAARESDGTIYVQAGPEVAVASTKAYTAQMVACALFALRLGLANGSLELPEVEDVYHELERVPDLIREVFGRSWQDKQAVRIFRGAQSALYLGRGTNSTTAYEGALKMKEIAYVHAEAYPAGEMKHGPIALLETGFPVLAIVPADHVHDKTVSNIQESIARGATVVALATDGDEQVAKMCEHVLWVPPMNEYLVPIVAVVHLQMLARFVAKAKGLDVDKPRNLAKSVTVE